MTHKQDYAELFNTILKLKTVEDCETFFNDLCTINELLAMSQRVNAARLLLEKNSYEQVLKKTNISSATLSRVSKCVKYGEGYKKFVEYEQQDKKENK